MIKIFRTPDDPVADEIEARFKDLILAYNTVIIKNAPEKDNLPKIEDGDAVITGDQEIEAWLSELESELKWQRALSGDGCYINPKTGTVC